MSRRLAGALTQWGLLMKSKNLNWGWSVLLLMASVAGAQAQKQYDPGASDTEIKIGQTMPYSGPVSALSIEGRVQSAYYAMINERGGINGRKINLISLDDGYGPAKNPNDPALEADKDGRNISPS